MLTPNTILDKPHIAVEYIKQIRRTQPKKPVFVTESNRDSLVLSELIQEFHGIAIPIKGKPKCLEAVELAFNSQVSGCAALVDADFDRIKPTTDRSFPLFMTDFYDLEAYAIFSESWVNVLNEYIDAQKVSSINITSLADLRILCQEAVLPVVAVLYANNKLKCGIDFKLYDFGRKCNLVEGLKNSVELTIARLKELNPTKDWSKEEDLVSEAKLFIASLSSEQIPLITNSKMMCCCLIAVAKAKSLRRKDKDQMKEIDASTLKKWFRSHVRVSDLRDTKMFQEIQKWLFTIGFTVS